MKPVLFTIGSYNVYAFGAFLAISFVVSTYIVWWFGREDLKEEQYIDAYVTTSLIGLFGARLGYIFAHPSEFGLNILRFLLVRETPGLSLIGGFITGGLFLLFYCRNKKLSFGRLSDIFSCAMSLALVFVKIGQLLGGAAMGRITDSVLAVRVVGLAGRRHPVEFYEALLYFFQFLLLLVFIRVASRRKWPQATAALLFTNLTACTVFALEFLKEYTIYLYGLSSTQVAAGVTALVTLVLLIVRLKVITKILGKFKKKQ